MDPQWLKDLDHWAWWADWGLCLARTNWDVPKHRGLTVFMLEIHQPGIDVHRIEMLNGSRSSVRNS
jgi:alkylation response protein AidB-like acyl-CoA dehydrogenase